MTETVVEEGETVEVTRVVTEVQEVMVTPEVAEEEMMAEPVTLYWNWVSEPPIIGSGAGHRHDFCRCRPPTCSWA